METTENIWHAYRAKLTAFIKSRVHPDAVDDLLQEVFMKVHKRLDSLKDDSKIESWIYQITRNAIIDHYRSRQNIEDIDEWLEKYDGSDEDQLRKEFASCLHPIIQQLPENYREAIQLSEIELKSHQEVADQIGISLSGVKSRVQRGRKLLKGLLHECCEIELDRHNRLVSYQAKNKNCQDC